MGLSNWLKGYREYRLERLRLISAKQTRPFDALVEIVKEQSEVAQKQTAVLQEWISQFRVVDVPKSSVVREEDEWRMEQERMGYLPRSSNATTEDEIDNALLAGDQGAFQKIFDAIK